MEVELDDYKLILTHLYWLLVDKCVGDETPWDFYYFKTCANRYGLTEESFELVYDPYEKCFE